ncbi:MAG: mechanosensitive ion channel family protein [Gemmatimonadaceae bacterium]|nr:mechanosensitive ion channel family protein [Gemmatimonadaceae bacterium]
MTIDFSEGWLTIQRLINGFVATLPRLLLAISILVVFILVGKFARSVIRHNAMRRGERRTLELALGRIVQAVAIVLGVLIGVTAAFPSFTPANLISTLGIGGVAVGFAFKDIFQNFLAGILILVTRPFHVGDQIRFKEYEGTVEDIQTRATFIKTYDGRRVIVPNGELYTNPVIVNTAFPQRRWEYDIGIGYNDDVEQARGIILDTLYALEDVSPDPGADVILVRLADSSVHLRARWWTKSAMTDGLNAQDHVLTSVKRALTQAGIDLPYPTQQILFHDQTESTDGDRNRQREGWPAGLGDGSIPRASSRTHAGEPVDGKPHGAGRPASSAAASDPPPSSV